MIMRIHKMTSIPKCVEEVVEQVERYLKHTSLSVMSLGVTAMKSLY